MSVQLPPLSSTDRSRLKRLAAWASRRGLLQSAAGVSEQGVVALTSLGTLAVLSRLMSLHELGIVATALALWMLVEAVQRATVILPFVATCPRPEADPDAFGGFILLNLALSAAAALMLLAAGAAIRPFDPDLGLAATMAAPIGFSGSTFLFVRQSLYHLQRHPLAAVNAVLVALVTALGLVSLWRGGEVGVPDAVLVISLGYLLPSTAIGLWAGRRARYGLAGLLALRRHRHLMADFTAASLALHVATNSAQVLLSIASGPAAAAVFAFARTLARPLTLIIHSVVDVGRARLARQLDASGPQALPNAVRETQLLLVMLCAPPMILVLVWPGWLLHLFYGSAGDSAVSAARLWFVALVPFLLYSPMEAALTVLHQSRAIARINLAALLAMLCVVGLALLTGTFTASAAVVSIAAAYGACLVLVRRRYRAVLGEAEVST